MPDDLLHRPLRDVAHEALRQAVAAAFDDLADQVQRINDAFLMLSVNTDFAQATKNTVMSATLQMGGLSQQLAAINTRLAADQARDDTARADLDLLQTQMADVLARLAALEATP